MTYTSFEKGLEDFDAFRFFLGIIGLVIVFVFWLILCIKK